MKTPTLLLVIAAICCACEGSSVPLGTSERAPMDGRLVGRWELVELEEGEVPVALTILQFNEHEYYLEYVSEDEGSLIDLPDTLRFRAYTTAIGDALFANVQCIACEERTFFFFRYALSDEGLLTARAVDENIYANRSDALRRGSPVFETSQALYDFVREHLTDEALYGARDLSFRKITRRPGHTSPRSRR